MGKQDQDQERSRVGVSGHAAEGPTSGEASDGSVSETVRLSVYWKPAVWDLARSAYIADLDTEPDSPRSFLGWLARAVEQQTRRTPQSRAEIAEHVRAWLSAAPTHRKSFNQSHPLPLVLVDHLEMAVVADRQERGRVVARSGFVEEAVFAAAEQARERLGRGLPPAPAKLANRPPRGRSRPPASPT